MSNVQAVRRHSLAATGLLGILLLASKTIKLAYAYALYVKPMRIVLWSLAAVVVLVVLALVLTKLRHHLRGKSKLLWPASVAAALAVGFVGMESVFWRATGEFENVTLRFFEYFRYDALFLLAFFAAWYLLLRLTRGRTRTALTGALYGITAVILFIGLLELAFYLKTGNIGDWYLLQYAAIHAGYVAPAVFSELSAMLVPLIVVPVLAVGLTSRWASRTVNPESRTAAEFSLFTLAALGAAAILLLLAPQQYMPASYKPFHKNIFAQSIADAIGISDRAVIAQSDEGDDVLFDSRDAVVGGEVSSERPNIVVFVLESVRAESIQPYTYSHDVTPFLDSLSQHSEVFTKMYANLPYTSDALVALFYGIYPQMTPRTYFPDIAHTGIAEILGQVGYTSAFFTSATLSDVRGEVSLLENLGFDTLRDETGLPQEGFERVNYSGFEDRILTEPSVEWARQADDSGKPFFLTVLNQTSHHDYKTPSSFPIVEYDVDDDELNAYLNSLRYMDRFLMEVFTRFKEEGLYDNTVFLLVGDHGEAFGEHGVRFHGTSVYDPAMRIPLILHDGRNPVARVNERFAQQIDVFPTLAEIAGIELSNVNLPGYSVLDGLPVDRKIYLTAAANQALGLIHDGIKYVYSFRRTPMKVFALNEDPYELNDIADQFSQDRLEEVELELLSWQSATNRSYRMSATTE